MFLCGYHLIYLYIFDQVVLQKKSSGFGFTVRGSCPVKVSRVKDAGAAAAAGLMRGDHIISINDADVSTSTAQAVVHIIK